MGWTWRGAYGTCRRLNTTSIEKDSDAGVPTRIFWVSIATCVLTKHVKTHSQLRYTAYPSEPLSRAWPRFHFQTYSHGYMNQTR